MPRQTRLTQGIGTVVRGVLLAAAAAMGLASAASADRPPPVGPAELYFVAVGVGEYADKRQEFLPQAEHSATLVARALMAAGARHGILLTSRLTEGVQGHAVTRADVHQAIFDLKARIRADGATAPRIVIYAMGHGYGDPKFNMLFLQTGEVAIEPALRSQMGVSALVQRTLWNMDLISALVQFRIHPSMDYLDGFVPSQIMPDMTNPLSGFKTAQKAAEMQEEEGRRRRAGAFPPEGNPPVPYVLLMDNCFDGIAENLAVDGSLVAAWVDGVVSRIVDEGLVYYAAPPGESRQPLPLPDRLGGGAVGPLALRLLVGLETAAPGLRFDALAAAFEAAGTDIIHRVGSPLVADTARVEFLPDARTPGTLDRRFGSGAP